MWSKGSSISRGCNDGHKQDARGELTAYVQITDTVRAGEVVVSFVKLAESGANILTNSAFHPFSKIPEYKVCAVRIERVDR